MAYNHSSLNLDTGIDEQNTSMVGGVRRGSYLGGIKGEENRSISSNNTKVMK